MRIVAEKTEKFGETITKECYSLEIVSLGDERGDNVKFFVLNRDNLGPDGKKLLPGLTKCLEKIVKNSSNYL